MTKVCRVCKREKDTSEFYDHPNMIDRLLSLCKECHKVRTRLNYSQKRETILEYRSKDPKGRYQGYKGRAKRKKLRFDLSLNNFSKIIETCCVYCGEHEKLRGLDRLDNALGYTVDNVVSCCFMCNQMKSNRATEKFLEHCEKVVSHNYAKSILR